MLKKHLILLILLLLTTVVKAQIGGLRAFEFLEIPNHAMVAGIGTVNVSAGAGDVNMVNQNPALLDSLMNGDFSLTVAPYFADIINTQLNYAHSFEKVGILHFGVLYQSFGSFDGYDNTGNATEEFTAGNYLVSVAHSRQQGVFNYGVSLKLVGTQLVNYTSSAILLDIGGTFKHPKHDLTAGMVIKNIGFYTKKGNAEDRNLPFDIQLGATFKPEFMPFRFSLTMNKLYQYDLTYFEPIAEEESNPFADANANPPGTFDKIFQHITLGTEIILSKSVQVRSGYNHLIRQSLKDAEFGGAGGFTFGLNFQTKKINLAYSNAIYQVGGAAHFITVGTNINSILKRKNP